MKKISNKLKDGKISKEEAKIKINIHNKAIKLAGESLKLFIKAEREDSKDLHRKSRVLHREFQDLLKNEGLL